jgi:ElaB/YqjD/DUF883 family membrane-anchored ribosome-binding protein
VTALSSRALPGNRPIQRIIGNIDHRIIRISKHRNNLKPFDGFRVVEAAVQLSCKREPQMAAADPTTKFTRNASATVESLQEDLTAMRDDVGKLSQQVVDLLSAKGSAAYKRAKKNFDARTGEAADAVREVRDTFADAIEESVQERPLATLAIALGIGFVIGATWRR